LKISTRATAQEEDRELNRECSPLIVPSKNQKFLNQSLYVC